MSVLSRLLDKSMFGLGEFSLGLLRRRICHAHFSNDVARLVTQPLWPSRTPRITNCSDILAILVDAELLDECRNRT